MKKTDEELFCQFLDGCDRSFEELMQRYQGPLIGYIYKTLGERDKAEEVFQETFIRAFKFSHTYEEGRKFKSWIYSIAVNLCRDEIKHIQNQPSTASLTTDEDDSDITLSDEEAPPDRDSLDEEMSDMVEQAIYSLSSKHREVLILHHFQGLKYEEIAHVLGRKVGTVKSQLHYAVLELRKVLEPHIEDSPSPSETLARSRLDRS